MPYKGPGVGHQLAAGCGKFDCHGPPSPSSHPASPKHITCAWQEKERELSKTIKKLREMYVVLLAFELPKQQGLQQVALLEVRNAVLRAQETW